MYMSLEALVGNLNSGLIVGPRDWNSCRSFRSSALVVFARVARCAHLYCLKWSMAWPWGVCVCVMFTMEHARSPHTGCHQTANRTVLQSTKSVCVFLWERSSAVFYLVPAMMLMLLLAHINKHTWLCFFSRLCILNFSSGDLLYEASRCGKANSLIRVFGQRSLLFCFKGQNLWDLSFKLGQWLLRCLVIWAVLGHTPFLLHDNWIALTDVAAFAENLGKSFPMKLIRGGKKRIL